MSFFPAITKAGKTKAKVRDLTITSNKIMEDQKQLTVAYSKLDTTSGEINIAIGELKTRDLDVLKDAIDKRDIPKDYKDKLKTELDNSRERAVGTLIPLRVKAEKLCANMLVSQEKALQYWSVLRAQANVLQSGSIQLRILKELHQKGAKLTVEIEDLLHECEEINQVVDNKRPIIDLGKQDFSGSIIPPNPFIEKAAKRGNGTTNC